MIREYLFQDATLELVTGRNLHAEPAYGSPRSLPVRVQHSKKLVKGPDGDLVESDAVGWSEAVAGVELNARLTCEGERYRVVAVLVGQALFEAEFFKFYLERLA